MKCLPRQLLMTLVLVLAGSSLAGPIRFEHLTINDGLPENSVRSILQDRHGFLWFGTQNGVARFDGTHMNIHLPDSDDPSSIGIRFVLALAEDEAGFIWMGSYSAGLSRYDPATETFTNFSTEGDSLPGPGIATIRPADDGVWITSSGGLHRYGPNWFERIDIPAFADQGGVALTGLNVNARELWIGSSESGVALQNRADGTWRHFRHDPADPENLPSDFVTFIERDQQGRIWVGGRAGLSLYTGNGSFTVFKPQPDLGAAEVNYLVCMAEDPQGDLWIGSAVGLYHFDPIEGVFTLHAHDPENPESPVMGPVLSILCDWSGIIWAGSWHTGLNKYDPGSGKFVVYLHDADDPGSLDNDAIGAVFEDSGGTLWVGTGSRSSGGTVGGLNRRDPGSRDFHRIPFPEIAGMRVRTVNIILEDREGRLWLGTNRGIWQVDDSGTKLIRLRGMESAPAAILNGMVMDLALDHAGRVWVAAWMGGLHRYDPLTRTWISYRADPDDPHSLTSDDLTTIDVDFSGRIWIGTDSGGVQIYDPEQDSFLPLTGLGVSLEGVFDIVPADDDRVWIASTAGILLCDSKGVVEFFTTRTGLPSDFAGRLILDNNGDLWASTGLGLTRVGLSSGEITVFDERDGLPCNEVHFAALSTADGHLYFGGHHGLVSFHPDSLMMSPYVPPVHITEIRVRDEPLDVGPDSPLMQSLTVTAEIRLGPEQNDISLTFAALDFSHPERNQYRFRLDPLDQDWRDASGRNTAYYTNLDPGIYTFSVMGSNGDGLWNETPTTLRLVINPPWYRTNWANFMYVVVALLLMVGIFRQLLNRERMRMALEIERTEAHHLQNLDQLKSRFFTNISHEFRTPLTLLISPLQRLQEDPTSGSPELFGTMARNARRLGRLVDQLLDLSRLEADHMPARWRHGDWCQYLRALTSSFSSLAEQRNIVLETDWPEQTEPAWYDPDLLDKILVNLLSNALKFTPSGGEVTLTVAASQVVQAHPWPGQTEENDIRGEAHMLTITVLNTGSYIPPGDLDNVFDRFHQVVENSDFGDLGSGIGLALVKELAEWCGGEVGVGSDRQNGTTFLVTLPLYLSAPPGDRVITAQEEPTKEENVNVGSAPGEVEGDMEDLPDSVLPSILLVEDNADLRHYVREELSNEFQVLVAANGKSGLELARREIPDLVLSDVMMPVMDGLELCRELKADDLTNHIPVILLTAKAEASSRKEGLQTGADDYVAKPFDVEELRIRIHNLIEQRRLLAERYNQLEVARPGRASNPVPSADDRFLVKAREIIAANLEDPDFRVEALCKEIGMSRTQLHRKLKAVAGRSAGDFLRVERLNKAAEMLSRGEDNVTGVAYSVGYRSLSQFAKAFREQFGMAPSDFEA